MKIPPAQSNHAHAFFALSRCASAALGDGARACCGDGGGRWAMTGKWVVINEEALRLIS